MGKRFEDLMFELGRSVRRLVDGHEEPARNEPRSVDAAGPGKFKVERTQDGDYRIGGFLFTTEEQALDFAKRRQRRHAQPMMANSVTTGGDEKGWGMAPGGSVQRAPPRTLSPGEQELMAIHGIELSENGGFRAAGYVFTSLDQAVSWANRRRSPSHAGPRLMSHSQPVVQQSRTDQQPIRTALSDFLDALSPSDARQPSQTQKLRWLHEPTTITVGGLSITTDLVHVGKADRYDYHANKALIDPSLKIAAQGDPYGTTLGYWPDYRSIDPRARRSYLEWLQGGRCDPETPIGYVFIFFYGLEYRLLKEGAYDEAPRILLELRRLLDIYGNHPSFDRYARRLVEVAELLAGEGVDELVPSSELRTFWELPLKVRVALGRKVGNGEPLKGADALAWVLASPETYLRTPAQRCFGELKELWARRYQAAYPDGFRVHIPKARIQHDYRAAGANFTATISLDQLPDVSGLDGPVKRFRTLLEKCIEDLDPYSRFLGRNPDKKQSIAAAILLPTELHDGESGAQLRACREQLHRLRAADTPPSAADVLRLLDMEAPPPGSKVPLATQRQMCTMLDLLDIGFEPDRRYGASSALGAETKLVLFQSEGGGKVEPDAPAYVAARTMAEIAALAAVSDGMVVPVELEAICRDLASLPGLGEVERQRLAAHAEALLDDPPKRKEAINRLAVLPQQVRQRIMHSAVGAILADGRVLPAEVRFLEGLHKTLGLAQEDVYALLHRASVSDDQPVTVAPEARTPGIALPAEPAADAALIRIDASRLDRIRNETLEVSELLANIFVDEAEAVAPTFSRPVEMSRFEQLDRAHSELLWRVISEPVALEEFEAHARSVKLLPEGAIDTINEWGFDTFEETVIALEEVVYVHEHLVDQLRSMGESA
jgi:hypothetical protein